MQDLQSKQKELTKSLPITTQITILEKEINQLTTKPTKTKAEEKVLESKKKELAELLKKQGNTTETKPSDRTGLYVGLGIIGVVLILGLFIFARIRKKKGKY